MSGPVDWIKHRVRAGYDFGKLVRAMSRLVVRPVEGGLEIDATAIEDDGHSPTKHTLLPTGDGTWSHEGTGDEGPLFEWMATVALSSLERPREPAPSDVDFEVTRKPEPTP